MSNDFFSPSRVIKSYLGFDYHLLGEDFPCRVRIIPAGLAPTDENALGGFVAEDKDELQALLGSTEKVVELAYIKRCFSQ
jgi:hypothetical protein